MFGGLTGEDCAHRVGTRSRSIHPGAGCRRRPRTNTNTQIQINTQIHKYKKRMQETPAHKYKYTNTQIQKKDARDARAYNSCPGIFAIPQLSLGFWDELTRYQFSRLFLGKLDPVSGSTLRAQLSWVQLSGAQFAWNH